MKKKNLEKAIVLGLLLSSLAPMSLVCADFTISEDGKTLIGTENLAKYKPSDHNGRELSSFENIEIDATDDYGYGKINGRLNIPNTNLTVIMNSKKLYSDGVRLWNWDTQFEVNDYTAEIHAPNSDALNLDHGGTHRKIIIHGSVNAIVDDGSGLRANVSTFSDTQINTITVEKDANITISGNKDAALWAGADTYFDSNYVDGYKWEILGHTYRKNEMTKGKGQLYVKGKTNIVLNGAKSYGLWAGKNGYINVNDLIINGNGKNDIGVAATDGNLSYTKNESPNRVGSEVVLNGDTNIIHMNGENSKAIYAASQYGKVWSGEDGQGQIRMLDAMGDVVAEDKGTIKLNVKTASKILGSVNAEKNAAIGLESNMRNYIGAGNIDESTDTGHYGWFGDKTAIKAIDSVIDIKTNNNSITKAEPGSMAAGNFIAGTVHAENNEKHVQDGTAKINITAVNGNNFIMSSAHGRGYDEGTENLSAVFARYGAEVNISGNHNYLATYHGSETGADQAHVDHERVVWAQGEGTININGATTIVASRAELNSTGNNEYGANNMGVAITAGSEQQEEDVNIENKSKVNVNYSGAYDSQRWNNYISGDIVSGFNGLVNVKSADKTRNANDNIRINGNLLAGNDGQLNVDLGNGGALIGRVDDYRDVTNENDTWHTSVYNPVFSNEMNVGGTVNLNMGSGSTWNVTGQSWVTNLGMGEGSVVDLRKNNNVYEIKAHALTIRNVGSTVNDDKVSGTAQGSFIMNLNHNNHNVSDMLYIENGEGSFDVELEDTIDGAEKISDVNTLRFATVGDKAIKFNSVRMYNEGLYDITYKIDSKPADDDIKDSDYNNGTTSNGSQDKVDQYKPGDSNVNKDGAINWYIYDVDDRRANNSAKVIVDMSRANYSNAVYMDRLNKRTGEMRYINDEEDTGLWVRMRHDWVGKDDAFKYKSNMYEIGYDEKQDCDNGKRRVGVAIDYMHGDTTYSNVGGKGEISRKGVWLYDTWLGDKGHYADYVAKWGHLANDYEIYNLKNGDKITGDYDNNVFSLSAEYGRKKDMGNSWYIEPQAQLQYAYVTDADYHTTQGTDVSLDSIHSLIGRAGFRLGKDTDERSTIYFKADLLHEFLGDQDIYARDKTGEMRKNYDNKGTWYDLGFGFATALNKDSYLYADFERSFGNDNDNTWQVNVGANWSF